MLAMLLISLLGHRFSSYQYHKVDALNALLDAAGFCGFCTIALFARRIWPLWVSSLQLIAVLAHVSRAMDIDRKSVV